MPLDDSTIPDLREQIADLRHDTARLEQWINATDKDVDELRRLSHSHMCDPHATQAETAELRIVMRQVLARLAVLEAGTPLPPPEVPNG